MTWLTSLVAYKEVTLRSTRMTVQLTDMSTIQNDKTRLTGCDDWSAEYDVVDSCPSRPIGSSTVAGE